MSEADASEAVVTPTSESLSQALDYCHSRQTRVLTLFFSDLVGSTGQQTDLGNIRAAELVRRHRDIFREVIKTFDGREVETAGDSFLAIFAAPSEGVKFALHLQAAMRRAQESEPQLPSARCALHQGQVVVDEHAAGPKPLDIYGLQVSTTARIMDLAHGGQILLSRSVFDDARAILVREELAGLSVLSWENYGPYRFKGVENLYEVCEVREDAHTTVSKPFGSEKSHPAEHGDIIYGWRPGPNERLPKSNWIMERLLGEGGFGEVWLARDANLELRKTVFKFCSRKSKVKSLRRELNVFNKLCLSWQNSHPEIAAKRPTPPGIVEVRGSNDAEAPYYIELEYVSGGDLRKWIDEHGKDVPLRQRLEVAKRLVQSLVLVHEAGFLHRDVKPSNYLIVPPDDPRDAPGIKLTDFGIGQEAVREVIEASTITAGANAASARYSLQSASLEGAAGTYLFIAPELFRKGDSERAKLSREAQTPADVYSLGVTLYQLFTGSTEHVPGPGLEELSDEILRDDIKACLNTKPDQRPSAAAILRGFDNYEIRQNQLLAIREQQRVLAEEREREERKLRERAEKLRLEAENQKNAAVAARERAEHQLYVSSLLVARIQIGARQFDLARETLWQTPESLRNWEWGYYLLKADSNLPLYRGHDLQIRSASFSPCGNFVLTASYDCTARIWEAATGRPVSVMEGHTYAINSAAFNPEGTRAITGSNDGTARIWDVMTGQSLVLLEGHRGAVRQAQISPDGLYVVTASLDATARIWDSISGQPLHHLTGHEKGLISAALSPNGKLLATVSFDQTTRLWDMTDGKPLVILGGHTASVLSADFSPDGTRMITSSDDATARIWDVGCGSSITILAGHTSGVRQVSFDRQGKHVVTVSYDGTARIWDGRSGRQLALCEGHTRAVRHASFSPDGVFLATASRDNSVRVWEVASGICLSVLEGHRDSVNSVEFSPDGMQLVTASRDCTARLWDLSSGQSLRVLEGWANLRNLDSSQQKGATTGLASLDLSALSQERYANELPDCTVRLIGHSGPLNSASFSRDGKHVVTGGHDRTARIWDAMSGRPLATMEAPGSVVWSASFSPDGKHIVTACRQNAIQVWSSASGELVDTFDGHRSPCWAADYSPDGRYLATSTDDGSVWLWNCSDKSLVTVFQGHAAIVWSTSFSPDGVQIASASEDATARVWDTEHGRMPLVLEGHGAPIWSVAFSPDGSCLATASDDGTVRIWNLLDGSLLSILAGHRYPVYSASFSPEGSRIVTASEDGTARVWDLTSGQALAVLEGHGDGVRRALFSPDGNSIITASRDMTARIWRTAPFRTVELPGQDLMPWQGRYALWKQQKSQDT